MSRHFQSASRPGEALVTLDIIELEGDINPAPLCFCGDCGDCFDDPTSSVEQPAVPTRMRRILNHVEPTSNTPRNLLNTVKNAIKNEGVQGEIPWCIDLTEPEPVAANGVAGFVAPPRRNTGFRSPPCSFAPVAGETVAGAKASAIECIDAAADDLDKIAIGLWENPELNYDEVYAHNLLTDYLESTGATVERSYCDMPTAFKATYDTGVEGPTVGICCEFDALPGIGHACGHNLIAEASTAAFHAVKHALEHAQEAVAGKVVIIGTPAEEGSCGKVELIKRGGFEGIDASLMAHRARA